MGVAAVLFIADDGYGDRTAGWTYEYSIQDEGNGQKLVLVDYEKSSTGAVRAAADAMNHRADQLAASGEPFTSEIVFERPLAFDEYLQFVERTGAYPQQIIIRAIDGNGMRVTIGSPPIFADGQIDPNLPALDTTKITEEIVKPSWTVLGVVTAEGVELDSESYAKVRSDPRVYAVGVLSEVIIGDIQEGVPDLDLNKVFVQPSNLYWNMEEVGIAPVGAQQ